jgi:hypothetical protein
MTCNQYLLNCLHYHLLCLLIYLLLLNYSHLLFQWNIDHYIYQLNTEHNSLIYGLFNYEFISSHYIMQNGTIVCTQ